jgi:hypothetical protein
LPPNGLKKLKSIELPLIEIQIDNATPEFQQFLKPSRYPGKDYITNRCPFLKRRRKLQQNHRPPTPPGLLWERPVKSSRPSTTATTALQLTNFPSSRLLPLIHSPIVLYKTSPSYYLVATLLKIAVFSAIYIILIFK